MAVDKAGDDRSPAGVDTLVGRPLRDRPARARPPHDPIAEDQRGIGDQAERPFAERGVVGDERPDAVDQQVAHASTARMAESSFGGDVADQLVAPLGDDVRPPTTTSRTSAAPAAKTQRLQQRRGGGAGQPDRVRARSS